MNREVHVRICGQLGAKFPGPTRQFPGPTRPEFLTWKTITSQPTIGKAKPSTRAKWLPYKTLKVPGLNLERKLQVACRQMAGRDRMLPPFAYLDGARRLYE